MAIFGISESDSFVAGEDEFIQDPWSWLDYKRILATDQNAGGLDKLAPDWMGPFDRRRIQAYTAAHAICANNARGLLKAISPKQRKSKEDRREYGDAKLLVDTVVAAVLGDQQSIAVDGAELFDEDSTDDPDKELHRQALERQEFLREWGERERAITKFFETEGDTGKCGDGVYCLEWSSESESLRLITRDAASYFPVLGDTNDNQYPCRVHFAWQEVDPDDRAKKIRIHRITYDLRDVDAYDVPWEDEKVTKACFLSEGIFEIDKEMRHVDDLTTPVEIMTDADGEVWDRNLGLDFLPIVHLPNTVAEKDHFGTSTLAPIGQVLDDLQATDSDLQKATSLTGSPTLWLGRKTSSSSSRGSTQLNPLREATDAGTAPSTTSMALGPDVVLDLGENGTAGMLSGAEGLEGLAKTRDDLIDRFLINARVAASAVGRVETDKVAAGVILALSFGPMDAMVKEKRLVRKDKYRLLWKFVQRMYWKQGVIEGVFPADLVFGSFLPTDRKEIVDLVIRLVEAKLISRLTGMKMLQEAGIPIVDPAKEEEEINRNDLEAANQLADLGAEKEVEKRLGVKLDRPTAEQVVGLNQPPDVEDDVDANKEVSQGDDDL